MPCGSVNFHVCHTKPTLNPSWSSWQCFHNACSLSSSPLHFPASWQMTDRLGTQCAFSIYNSDGSDTSDTQTGLAVMTVVILVTVVTDILSTLCTYSSDSSNSAVQWTTQHSTCHWSLYSSVSYVETELKLSFILSRARARLGERTLSSTCKFMLVVSLDTVP